MGKPNIYGMKTRYVPNSQADRQFHHKIFQRGRVIAERDPSEARERRQMKELERMKAEAYRAS